MGCRSIEGARAKAVTIRADHAVMKWIYRNRGLKALMEWQRLPFVDGDSCGSPSSFFEFINTSRGKSINPRSVRLMFPEFILWARAKQPPPGIHLDPRPLPGPPNTHAACRFSGSPQFVGIQVWQIEPPDVAFVSMEEVCGKWSITDEGGSARVTMRSAQSIASSAFLFAAWLESLVSVPVEAVPLHASGKRMTAKLKPWAREDLPRIILIDPKEAHRYGHRADHGGSHASPIPHPRRGGPMTLRHPRYGENQGKVIWRRGTWVGDRECVHHGTTYRVLDTAQAKA